MSEATTIPPRLILLGTALRPCLARLSRRIDEPVLPDTGIGDGGVWLQAGLNRLQNNIAGLNNQFDRLTREILDNEHASEADIHRGIGRFEAFLDGFLDDRDGIRRTIAPWNLAEARDILASAYRHTLVEILDWLARLADVLEDPLAEARRQGLPEDGYVQMELTLVLTTAPEIAWLSAWMKRQRAKKESDRFWKLVGGLAIGALFLDGIIDNDRGPNT